MYLQFVNVIVPKLGPDSPDSPPQAVAGLGSTTMASRWPTKCHQLFKKEKKEKHRRHNELRVNANSQHLRICQSINKLQPFISTRALFSLHPAQTRIPSAPIFPCHSSSSQNLILSIFVAHTTTKHETFTF